MAGPPVSIRESVLDVSNNSYFPQNIQEELLNIGIDSGPRQDPRTSRRILVIL